MGIATSTIDQVQQNYFLGVVIFLVAMIGIMMYFKRKNG